MMKGLFSQYDYSREIDYAYTWKNATFVFDTNVLLNLYRYQERTREELLDTLSKLSSRVWVPHHVALEFQRNRLTVIAGQGKGFSDIRKLIEKTQLDLSNGINNLQLRKRHSLINPDELVNDFQNLSAKYLEKLGELHESQQSPMGPDPIKDRVEEIFDNKVGNPYGTQDEIDKINRQAEMRYKLKIPPGYQDDGKDKDGPDEFCHNGLIYKRKYGDYFVWSQMLSYTADQEIKQLIFITDDGKDDWWCQVDFGGSKTIGPRAELNEEVARLGKVETFLMYKPEGFLKYANEFLHAEISQETLTEVHDVSLENKLKFLTIEEMHSQDVQALASVLSWVEGKYDLAFFNDEEFPDIFGLTDIEFHGYKVNLFRGRSPALYRDILLKSVGAMAKQAMSSLTIVFIARTAGEARMVMNALERVSNVNAPDNLYICIGSIDSSHGNQFDPIHEFGFNSIAHY